jgi:hypothetical protein
MIPARSSRPERYRLSPPIAGCRARIVTDNAHVAKLDNAPDYGSGRWRFESFRARQLLAQTAVLHQLPALQGPVTSPRKRNRARSLARQPFLADPLITHGLRRTTNVTPDHAPAGADAAERGYFAFQARGRWFESNSGDHPPIAQRIERFTFRPRPLLGSV